MERRGWNECDFIFVSGDAYADHPTFAVAMICRVLEAEGFRVGIIAQPAQATTAPSPYAALGRPRLAFLIGAGNLDSMVAHYTAAKKPRSEDAYSPGGAAGFRPDRALLKYVEGVRRAYKNVPVIIGGLEASLRRFAHYDYWSDTVRRSILLDSKADILVYGMGERAITEIARRLADGQAVESIRDVRGTSVIVRPQRGEEFPPDAVKLPGYQAVHGRDADSLRAYADHFMLQKLNSDPASGKALLEETAGEPPLPSRWVLHNPPAFPLSEPELDRLYELPFTRRAHPMYDASGGIPALKEVAFSLATSRGCFGGCSFCAIALHQGRAVQSRSSGSLVKEAAGLTRMDGFKGYIHDAGGPTANFYRPACGRQEKGSFCPQRECLYPTPCPHLKTDHGAYLQTLAALRNASPKIKKVFIRSGLRFDFIEMDKQRGGEFFKTLCRDHVSGQLKVAPEHISQQVLAAMGKSGDYEHFR
ncbi:MAG: YgiQ family radical SAM protein, partial [Treponema sp.]|nr:YgiQ family radical SAM protein [Treponema sp.]